MNKKTIWAVVLLVIIIIVIYAFSTHNNSSQSASQSLQKVTISEAFAVFLHSPLWIAQDKGFFKQQGLDVTITTAGGDEKAFASVLSGDAQFAIGDPTFIAISGEKGEPGVDVAAVLNGVPFWGLAKSASIPQITNASMLKGYTVGTLPAPSTDYVLQKKMFQSVGLTPNIKEIQFGGFLAALDAKQVDIALEFEPNVSQAVKQGYHVVYSLDTQYPDFAVTGLTALPDYVKNNPEVVQKVVNALQEADTYLRSNPKDAADTLATQFNVDRGVAEAAVQNMINLNIFPVNTETSQAAWQAATQLRVDLGDLKVLPDYATYIDNSFAQKAASIQ